MAAAGHCPFCLFNPLLPPDERFRQFTKKLPWQQHLDGHFDGLEGKEALEKKDGLALASDESNEIKATPCPDPRCGLSFNAIVDLQYHAQDTHCYKRTKASASKRRCCTSRPHSKAEDSFIASAESAYSSDSPAGNHQSYFVEEAVAMSNSDTTDPAVSPRDCVDALLSSAHPQLSEVTASVDSCSGPHAGLLIDPSLSDLEQTNLASAMGLGTSYPSSERKHSSIGNSSSESGPHTPDAMEAPWPVELPILPSWAVTDATASTPSSAGSQQRIRITVSKMADVAMMQTLLEPRPATGQWLDRKARNLPPIGANKGDDRTAEDTLAFTGDGEFPSQYTTPNDAIGSLGPGEVDDDAIFGQYLCSPSPPPSPAPTLSPDDTTSELSGATLFDAGRDPSRGCLELYAETSRSPAPEISPSSEIARDQDHPCHSANGTSIHLRVSQPKITLRFKLPDRGRQSRKKIRKWGRSGKRGNPGTQTEGRKGKGR